MATVNVDELTKKDVEEMKNLTAIRTFFAHDPDGKGYTPISMGELKAMDSEERGELGILAKEQLMNLVSEN